MTESNPILHRLKGRGYRLTESRRRLLDAVRTRSEGFTAEDLVSQVTGVGRATVYRTLRLLVEQGLLCKVTLQDGTPRYALAEIGHHHHLVCARCGSVREFQQSVIERVLRDLNLPHGNAVVGHRIEVYVLCAQCRPNTAKTSTNGSQPEFHCQH